MKKTLFLFITLFFIQLSKGQEINVVSANETVDKIQRTGLKIHLTQSESHVADAWENYLKKFGRVESSRNNFVVNEGKVASISNKPIRIVSRVAEEGKNESYVFLAIDNGKDYITAGDPQFPAAQQFLKDFALKINKENWADKLTEAEKLLNSAQKDLDRKNDKDKDLNKSVEKSKQNVIDYQKKIENEQSKQVDLGKQIVENKKAIQASALEVEKAKKDVDLIKQKMGDIK